MFATDIWGSASTGTVYIVATPIGNLEDMTLRAIAVLKAVDIIASEDTRCVLSLQQHSLRTFLMPACGRRTGRLLKHFGISKPQVSHHEHNFRTRAPELVAMAQEGKSIAVRSPARVSAAKPQSSPRSVASTPEENHKANR